MPNKPDNDYLTLAPIAARIRGQRLSDFASKRTVAALLAELEGLRERAREYDDDNGDNDGLSAVVELETAINAVRRDQVPTRMVWPDLEDTPVFVALAKHIAGPQQQKTKGGSK